MKENQNIENLIGYIAKYCIKNKVTLLLSYSKKVNLPEESKKCASLGFFESERKLLAIATKHPSHIWMGTLLHEFNHVKQWINGEFFLDDDSLEAENEIWDWLEDKKKKLSKKKALWYTKIMRDCEEDCEKKAIKMIQDFNLGDIIDLDKYIQRANAYLYFYKVIALKRKWYKIAPYTIKEITDTMPTTLMKNFDKLPDGYEDLVVKHCLRKRK